MPKYTPADIDQAFQQGLINEKEKRFLRQKVFQDATEEEGLTRKLITKLSHEVTEGWKKLGAGASQASAGLAEKKSGKDVAAGNLEAVSGALQILSTLNTVAGNLTGENVHDYLFKRGANPFVAALAASVSDAIVQVAGIGGIAKGVKTLATGVTAAAKQTPKVTSEQVTKAIGEWITEKQNPKNLVDVIRPGQDIKAGTGVMQGKRLALPSPTKQLNPPAIPMPPPPNFDKAGKLIDDAIESGEPLDLAALTQAVNAPNPVEAIKRGLHASSQAEGATKQLDMLTPRVFTSPKEPAAVSEEVVKRGKEFIAKGEEAAAPKPFKLTPADTHEMKRAMEKETDPFTLMHMAMEPSTPRDIRQVAANRLNEINKKDVTAFLKNEADPEFLARISRSNMFDPVTKQYAKDRVGMMQRGGLDTPSNVSAEARARMKFAEGEANYEAHRINLKDLQAEAAASPNPMTINDVLNLKAGEAKNPHEVAAISKPLREMGENFVKGVDEAEAGVAKGDYSKFWEMQNDFNLMVEAHWPYMSPRQVAGQTTGVYREPTLSVTRFIQQIPAYSSWMAKLKLNTIEEVEAAAPLIIKEWQKIKAPNEISAYAARIAEQTAEKGDDVFKDPTWRDKAYFWFVNSLMSGTDTIGRNITGNTLAVPWHYLETQTTTAAKKVINPFLTAEHKIDTGNFTDANAGMAIWFRTMYDASKYVFRRQFDEIKGLVPSESAYSELFANRFDLPKYTGTGTTNPFGGGRFVGPGLAKVIGTPVSIAQTSDEISRIAAYKLEVGIKAHAEWASSNSQVPWRQYIDEVFDNPPPSMHAAGIKMAQELTFSDPISGLGRTVMFARKHMPGFEFVTPFVHAADRLTAYGFNRTPGLQMLSTRLWGEMLSGDPVLQAEATGRVMLSLVVGSGIFAATKTNAPDGMPLITGGGPTDRQLTMKMKDAGIFMPYTIWTPLGRYSYSNLQPMRGPMGMIADTSEIWSEMRNPTEASSIFEGSLLALTRNIFDVSYTKQIADMLDIWDKPSGSTNVAERFTANLVKGFVEPAIVRQIFRGTINNDPYVRETHGLIDLLAKDVYGWGLPARRNPLTLEPVLNPPRMLADVPGLGWVLPTSPVQPRTDAAAKLLQELKYAPPEFPRTLGGRTPSESPFGAGPLAEARDAAEGPKLEDHYRQEGMDYVAGSKDFDANPSAEVEALANDPEFRKLAPIEQKNQIDSIYHSRFKQATDMLKEKYPELQEAWEQKVFQRQQVRLPPEEREAFQATENAPPDIEAPPDFNVLPAEEAAP